MKTDAFKVVRDFEAALCEYTGAPFCVTTTSCTMALLLAVAWHLKETNRWLADAEQKIAATIPKGFPDFTLRANIEIPKRTYVSVPMSIIHAGGRPTFRDEDWSGAYQLKPLPIWDAARRFTRMMYAGGSFERERGGPGGMMCLSFHWSKILGIQQGGAILHDDPQADAWLRRARFDGRTEGVGTKDDHFDVLGWHAYMAPETAAAGLVRMTLLPDNIPDLPNDDYPDLSLLPIFQ